jgi:hypothetical protein
MFTLIHFYTVNIHADHWYIPYYSFQYFVKLALRRTFQTYGSHIEWLQLLIPRKFGKKLNEATDGIINHLGNTFPFPLASRGV